MLDPARWLLDEIQQLVGSSFAEYSPVKKGFIPDFNFLKMFFAILELSVWLEKVGVSQPRACVGSAVHR